MSRIEKLQEKINRIIQSLPDETMRHKAYVHSFGVSQFAALLAVRRDLESELAAVSGLLHDIYAYKAGTYEEHCQKGAVLAEEILISMSLFDANEIEIVRTAILRHDNREEIHSPYDEVLKDADILQPYFYKLEEPVSPPARARFISMSKELGFIDSMASCDI